MCMCVCRTNLFALEPPETLCHAGHVPAIGRRLQVRLIELGAAREEALDEVAATVLKCLV